MTIISRRAVAANGAFDAVKNFYFTSRYGERRTDPSIADFTFGNPHEMPLEGIVAAIREGAVPQNQDWFAYKTSEDAPQAFLAQEVGRELSYSYGKVLLAPGQRLGYLAISPIMPAADRQALRDVMFATQMALGWFPNAVMQYAVPHLDRLSIDVQALARRRNVLMRC